MAGGGEAPGVCPQVHGWNLGQGDLGLGFWPGLLLACFVNLPPGVEALGPHAQNRTVFSEEQFDWREEAPRSGVGAGLEAS